VIRGVTAAGDAFEEVGATADEASEATERFTGAQKDGAQAAEQMAEAQRDSADAAEQSIRAYQGLADAQENAFSDLVDATGQGVRALDSMEAAYADLRQRADITAEQMQENVAVMRRASDANRTFMRAGSGANQVLFSTGDLVQDLQFGLRGAGNNIAFVAEELVNLAARSGGARGAMRALGSSLLGAGGFIIGLQTLIALGPQIVSFFSDAEDEAKGFSKALDDAAGDMVELKSQFEGTTAQVPADRLRDYRDALEEAATEQDRLLTAVQAASRSGFLDEVGEGFSDLFASITGGATSAEEGLKAAPELAEALGLELETVRGAIQGVQSDLIAVERALKEQPEFLEEARRRQEALNQLLDEANTAIERQEASELALNEALKAGAEIEEDRLNFARERINELRGLEPVAIGIQLEMSRVSRLAEGAGFGDLGIGALETALQRGAFQTIDQINAALEKLDKMLLSATDQEKRNRILALQKALRGLRDEFQGIGQDGIKVGQAIESSLNDAFVQLGRAIGRGEDAMESFGQAAMNILANIARAIGKQLIAQGTALIASAILPGQQGNAAAGAAYIAAGTTLIASAGALSAGGGSTGPAGAQGQQQRPEGGGTGGVEIPGRREGGPVYGGMVYRTHGLGDREYFVPERDGAIVTESAMRAAGPSRQGVSVRTDTNVNASVSVDGPDIFELASSIEEATRQLKRVARQ
jgi:hypothetical protein